MQEGRKKSNSKPIIGLLLSMIFQKTFRKENMKKKNNGNQITFSVTIFRKRFNLIVCPSNQTKIKVIQQLKKTK